MAFLICKSFMIVVFCMLDLLLFYVFFEIVFSFIMHLTT
jgi:NADH:ubiquinone oxidoreductase subunit 4 (subunit M)